jgi:hypothetical protein
MSIFCDNFATCNETVFHDSEERARVKGWHIWEGTTMGGKHQRVVLGPRCVGKRQRPDKDLPPLMPGDQTMIQFEVEVEEAA